MRFYKVMHHHKLPAYNSQKICEVCYARVQGQQRNIEHYRNSPVNGIPVAAYRPLIFDKNGIEIPFPQPDAPLPPIQLRQPKVQGEDEFNPGAASGGAGGMGGYGNNGMN